MAASKYVGPTEQVFPLLRGRTSGTLVLHPGESYELDPFPGPAWWWDPQPPEPPADVPEPSAETGPDDRWADARPSAQPPPEAPPAAPQAPPPPVVTLPRPAPVVPAVTPEG